MRKRLAFLLGTLLALSIPAQVRAQVQDCELLPGAREASRSFLTGEEINYISGPARFICPGEVVLQADSAVGRPERGEVELLGNVFYQDSVKTLTADWAHYLRGDARLFARGDVVLTDRKSNSRIEGPELEYLPANETRPEAEAIIQGRPHAIFHQQRKPGEESADSVARSVAPTEAPADSAAQPLEVDADIMRLLGESRFLALGQVEMKRGETRGYAREGEFDQAANLMLLTGAARLEGEGYVLSGERIEASLEGERLHEVLARDQAALQADDLDLQAPELRIFFNEDKVERLVAVGVRADGDLAVAEDSSVVPEGGASPARATPVGATLTGVTSTRATPASPASRPVVTSRDLRLTADSIDALAPGQQIDRLIAVGSAYAIRAPDTLDVGLPEAIAHDWVVGDTITGYFVQEKAPPAEVKELGARDEGIEVPLEPDEKPKQRATLERLVAVGEGGGARSLYRIREKGHEAEPPSANYLVANRIVLVLRDGEVREVEADGPIEGMHLQPEGAAARRKEGTSEPEGAVSAPGSGAGGQR